MQKAQLTPKNFTPTIGAYSHGYSVTIGDAKLIFVTGQIAVDKDGKVVSSDVAEQTRFVFENIRQILQDGGASLDDVVKVQIFVTDMSDFGKISPVRNEYFAKAKPVSTLVQVVSLVNAGCKVEVEVVAVAKQA